MTGPDAKDDLHRYLKAGRAALLWKLEGLSEYDIRRPMTPSGTNLLGLIKHLAGVEMGYFGPTFDRTIEGGVPQWMLDEEPEPNVDMFATADESHDDILALYQQAAAHTDATVADLPLDAVGQVPWWPEDRNEVTLHRILVHVATETHRHAGHADIVRELIDGMVGLREDNDNMGVGAGEWGAHCERLESIAREVDQR